MDNKELRRELQKIHTAVFKRFIYVTDQVKHGELEHWEPIPADLNLDTFEFLRGDCVLATEKIIGRGVVKPIGEFEVGDEVLSYDFKTKSYVYKPIISKKKTGVLPVFMVKFSNKQVIHVTADSPMWTRSAERSGASYIKTLLGDIDLSNWWKKKVPSIRKLEVEAVDVEWLNEDLCFVLGHFLAEGFVSKNKSKVVTCGKEIDSHVIPRLNENKIPYTRYENNSGVPCLRYLSSKFKDFLAPILRNSSTMDLPDWVKYLPDHKIRAILDGYWEGDGHITSRNTKMYSTSCDDLADLICFLSFRLGEPIYKYKQEKHGGVGNKPIWRLEYNKNSRFNRDYGYPGLSEATIRSITPIGDHETVDITVADTETFIYESGIVAHNCEEFARVCRKLCKDKGYLTRLVVCYDETGAGHCVLDVDGYVLDNRFKKVMTKLKLERRGYKWVAVSGFNDGDPWFKVKQR